MGEEEEHNYLLVSTTMKRPAVILDDDEEGKETKEVGGGEKENIICIDKVVSTISSEELLLQSDRILREFVPEKAKVKVMAVPDKAAFISRHQKIKEMKSVNSLSSILLRKYPHLQEVIKKRPALLRKSSFANKGNDEETKISQEFSLKVIPSLSSGKKNNETLEKLLKVKRKVQLLNCKSKIESKKNLSFSNIHSASLPLSDNENNETDTETETEEEDENLFIRNEEEEDNSSLNSLNSLKSDAEQEQEDDSLLFGPASPMQLTMSHFKEQSLLKRKNAPLVNDDFVINPISLNFKSEIMDLLSGAFSTNDNKKNNPIDIISNENNSIDCNNDNGVAPAEERDKNEMEIQRNAQLLLQQAKASIYSKKARKAAKAFLDNEAEEDSEEDGAQQNGLHHFIDDENDDKNTSNEFKSKKRHKKRREMLHEEEEAIALDLAQSKFIEFNEEKTSQAIQQQEQEESNAHQKLFLEQERNLDNDLLRKLRGRLLDSRKNASLKDLEMNALREKLLMKEDNNEDDYFFGQDEQMFDDEDEIEDVIAVDGEDEILQYKKEMGDFLGKIIGNDLLEDNSTPSAFASSVSTSSVSTSSFGNGKVSMLSSIKAVFSSSKLPLSMENPTGTTTTTANLCEKKSIAFQSPKTLARKKLTIVNSLPFNNNSNENNDNDLRSNSMFLNLLYNHKNK